jgi:hypothetical protein
MTRAKDELTIGLPLRFYVNGQPRNGDRHAYAMRTRFIPPEILDRFDAIRWSPTAQRGDSSVPRLRPSTRRSRCARRVGARYGAKQVRPVDGDGSRPIVGGSSKKRAPMIDDD